MKISSELSSSLLKYLTDDSDDGGTTSTDEFTTSILPSGTYTKLAASKYVQDNDADHDGVLEMDEVNISSAAYARLDANSDGEVSQAELADALDGDDDAIFRFYAEGGAKTSTDFTSQLLSSSNAGGVASNAYSALAAKRLVAELDKNGDSLLTSSESGLSASEFDAVDANADGELSLSELKSALAAKNSSIVRYYGNGGTSSLESLAERLLETI